MTGDARAPDQHIDERIDRLVDAWCARDRERALIPVDHEIIDATRSLRALICEEATSRGKGRDLLNALARLGRMIGERGGSPTLVASTADGLFDVLKTDAAEVDRVHARVALAEGFAAALLDIARADALATWAPPHCIVRIDESTVAIAAGFPDEDHELLAAWSARVTQWVLADKKRNAIVAGRPAAVHALVDALTLVGITLLESDGTKAAAEKRGSWLPWRRSK
jgi:hypothetical protein